jgi:hypothetical protein
VGFHVLLRSDSHNRFETALKMKETHSGFGGKFCQSQSLAGVLLDNAAHFPHSLRRGISSG